MTHFLVHSPDSTYFFLESNVVRGKGLSEAPVTVFLVVLKVRKIKMRQCKYLNNKVEQDHRNVKRRISIATGFNEYEPACSGT
jgi:transposase-like protein